jgi:hypothetical protein
MCIKMNFYAGVDWPGGTPGQIPVAWYNNRLNGMIIFYKLKI